MTADAPALSTGNRCGHDPAAPRWFAPPEDHGARPSIIRKWILRVRAFYDDPSTIPSLANAGRAVEADSASAAKPRRMRSERREACCRLLAAIAHYCDLPSLCLSVPQEDGRLRPIRMDTLAECANLSLRRAERAMRDIVAGGLISVHRRCEQREDGSYLGRAAIRIVPEAVFGLFGLEAQLAQDRRALSKKRRERSPSPTASAKIAIGMRAALNRVLGSGPAPAPAAAQIPEPVFTLTIPTTTPSPNAAPSEAAGPTAYIAAMKAILDGVGQDASRDPLNRAPLPAGPGSPEVRCDSS